MTKESILRLHKHFSILADGKFIERDFTVETPAKRPGEEPGRMSLGKMSPQRRDLIIADAKRHMAEIEEKFPNLFKAPEAPSKTKEVKNGSN